MDSARGQKEVGGGSATKERWMREVQREVGEKEKKKESEGKVNTHKGFGVWARALMGCGLESHRQYLNVLHFPPHFFY